jgi:demethylmenaquinone methyltransferase/2-methoxy-6-polyprenyl-1,4-benzoquinol methylase
VFGADFCHPMLVRARAKAEKRGRRISLLEADTLVLPLPDASVDLVGVAFGFRNLADYERGLAEMRRVLKPGGLAAILEFSRVRSRVWRPLFGIYFQHLLPALGTWISGVRGPYQYLPESVSKFPDQEGLAEMMRRHGFQNVRYRNFSAGIAALHLGWVPQPEAQNRKAPAFTNRIRAEKWL